MNRNLTLTFITLLLVSGLYAQNKDTPRKETYITSGMEMLFSFANIKENGDQKGSILRWAPLINVGARLNKDVSNKLGFYTGLSLRNVGYIYGEYKTNTVPQYYYKKKFRSYNLCIPLGIKIGEMDRMFFFTGYEVDFPILYKEKTFDQGDKIDKITGWFSKRQEWFQHGFMVGVQFRYGLNIRFKYYLSEFHNQDFVDSNGVKPYQGLRSNIFYFSFGSYLFRDRTINTSKSYKKV